MEELKQRKSKFRSHILTHRGLQLKIAGILVVSFVVFVALAGFLFVNNYQNVRTMSDGLEAHDSLMAKLLLVKQSKDLFWKFGFAMLAYMLCVSSYLMIYIHRMTGPVYKLTKVLEQAVQNNSWPKNIKFRKSDAFPELEQNFNYFLINFGERRQNFSEPSFKKKKRA